MQFVSVTCSYLGTALMIETEQEEIAIDLVLLLGMDLGTNLDHILVPVLIQKGMQHRQLFLIIYFDFHTCRYSSGFSFDFFATFLLITVGFTLV